MRIDGDHARSRRLGILDPLGGHPEPQVLPGGQPCRDQVLQHLVLRIQPHPATDQRGEVDAVPLAGEAQLDAVVAVADRADPG
ncbi:hypothetical protein GCM10009776_23640 [Microbacterium deminutum]|uniref:Uncharacterized protein n=1 Tax=Microbacterium deminutum TaxID=344164 RepID=A0ABN2QY71_9MICO